MIVKTYNDLKISVIRQTQRPAEVIGVGLQNCMRKLESTDDGYGTMTMQQAQFMIKADHLSPLEHVSMTIFVENVSRSFLAQVTRHRTFKFTSSSQHYQNYSDYPVVVSGEQANTEEQWRHMQYAIRTSLEAYHHLLINKAPKEEARQVLPNASAVNLLITADARNMVNFFRQRRCLRNVEEMIHFADTWWQLAVNWLPEIFQFIGAPCYETGRCTQGKMMAAECKEAKAHEQAKEDEIAAYIKEKKGGDCGA